MTNSIGDNDQTQNFDGKPTREMRRKLAEPRQRLLMEAEDLAESGDREARVAYHRWQAAQDDLDDAKALVAEVRQIKDATYWEVRAVALAQMHAEFAMGEREAELIAVVARRHRLEGERVQVPSVAPSVWH